jgi:hypothetical protein
MPCTLPSQPLYAVHQYIRHIYGMFLPHIHFTHFSIFPCTLLCPVYSWKLQNRFIYFCPLCQVCFPSALLKQTHNINFLLHILKWYIKSWSGVEKIYRALSIITSNKHRMIIYVTSCWQTFPVDIHFSILILSCCT